MNNNQIKVNAVKLVKELNIISGTGKKSGKPYVIAHIILDTPFGDYEISLDTFGDRNSAAVLSSVIEQLQKNHTSDFAEGFED